MVADSQTYSTTGEHVELRISLHARPGRFSRGAGYKLVRHGCGPSEQQLEENTGVCFVDVMPKSYILASRNHTTTFFAGLYSPTPEARLAFFVKPGSVS